MLAAAHCTPVNLNVSHRDIVIMSFNQNLVIVAICVMLEVIVVSSIAYRSGLINLSE